MARRAALIALAATSVAFAVTGCGTLGRAELRRGVESIGSMSAEGGLLAAGVAADSTKSTYTRAQARTLAEDAQHEAEKLADATPQPGYEARTARAVALAQAIGAQLGEIQTFPGDEARGRRAVRHFQDLSNAVQRLVNQL